MNGVPVEVLPERKSSETSRVVCAARPTFACRYASVVPLVSFNFKVRGGLQSTPS